MVKDVKSETEPTPATTDPDVSVECDAVAAVVPLTVAVQALHDALKSIARFIPWREEVQVHEVAELLNAAQAHLNDVELHP